jgi:squamous cell carcinoma antigen recognized by T-cells 3
MEETHAEFSAFVTKYNNDSYEAIMSSASKDYGKALKALREREFFELQLQHSGGSYEAYLSYIQWEQSTTKKVFIPALLRTLFERALVTHWQQPSLWDEYVHFAVYLMEIDLISQIQRKFDEAEIISVLDRATRNCPWSGDLGSLYLRYRAEHGDPDDTLLHLKERLVANPWLSAQPVELAKVYFAWLSICRFEIGDWDEELENVATIDAEVDECVEKIGTAWTYPHGYILGLLAVNIKTSMNDAEQAREIWDSMAKVNGTRCQYWLDLIAWEKYSLTGVC